MAAHPPATSSSSSPSPRRFSARARCAEMLSLWPIFLFACALSLCLNFGSKGSEIWVGTYVADRGLDEIQFVIYFCTISGKIAGDVLNISTAARLGRLRALQLGFGVCALSTLGFVLPLPEGAAAGWLLCLAFLQGVGIDLLWCNIYIYLVEIFPPAARRLHQHARLAGCAIPARASMRVPIPCPPRASIRVGTIRSCLAPLPFELSGREVEVADDLSAYLTEEAAPTDAERERPSRAVVLLPGRRGWKCAHTRRLADRIAVFCLALVLVPDVHRGGAPLPAGQSPPAVRIAADARSSVLYLRADHRVRALALLGGGDGGASHVLAAFAANAPALGAAAGVALCCPAPGVRPDLLQLR